MFSNWFKPSVVFEQDSFEKYCLGHHIVFEPDANLSKGYKVGLIGIDDIAADAIRTRLYQTQHNFSKTQLLDFGNIRNKSPEFLAGILKEMANQNINLILIGSDSKYNITQVNSFDKEVNIAFIDKKGSSLFEKDLVSKLIQSDRINKIKLLGFQKHLLHLDKIDHPKLSQRLSLGELRDNIRQLEPVLRDTSVISLSLNSIRYGEIPGLEGTSPSGLNSAEVCQIMRYAGLSPTINSIFINGYHPKYDFHEQGSQMVSQLIWYYIEGIDQQIQDRLQDKSNLVQYVVEFDDYDMNLTFYKSKLSGRWWVEVPDRDLQQPYLMPCSYEDYQEACNERIPNRVMNELKFL